MKSKLLIFQVINIVGLIGLSNILIGPSLGQYLEEMTIKIYGIMIALSIIGITYHCIVFLNRMDNGKKVSSSLSPIFRFLIVNVLIALTLSLLVLGFFYNRELLFVSLFMALFLGYSVVRILGSGFVLADKSGVMVTNYALKFNKVPFDQIKEIKKISPGLLYRMKYLHEGKTHKLVFIPKNFLYSLIGHPGSVNYLKKQVTDALDRSEK